MNKHSFHFMKFLFRGFQVPHILLSVTNISKINSFTTILGKAGSLFQKKILFILFL